MKKAQVILTIIFLFNSNLFGQGLNHQWLLGSFYQLQDPKGRMLIDSTGITLINENRKMAFIGTQGIYVIKMVIFL